MSETEHRIYTAAETQLLRKRQAARSKIMAVLLVTMCVLFFGITVVKIGFG